MKWKILMVLVLVWNRTICSLPFEICCPNQENALVVDTEAQVELYFDGDTSRTARNVKDKSLFNSFQQVVTPIVEFNDCDESCCRKKSNRNTWTKSRVTDSVARAKRFPMHLDPLYQYRFLSRSGRKLSPSYYLLPIHKNQYLEFVLFSRSRSLFSNTFLFQNVQLQKTDSQNFTVLPRTKWEIGGASMIFNCVTVFDIAPMEKTSCPFHVFFIEL